MPSMPEPLSQTQSQQYAAVAHAIAFIRAHAAQQPGLAEIAAAVGLGEHHLQRLFTAWAGVSPKRFLQHLTKEYARQALRDSADVLDAALGAGLSGPGRLHDLMVSCEALTPGEIRALGAGVAIRHGFASTPLGIVLLGWTDRGICHLTFSDETLDTALATLQAEWPGARWEADDAGAAALATQIFPAIPQAGRLHLLLRGTNFQIKVWEALLRVPPAALVSYSQLATWAGAPRAQRAVGSALAANSIAYLIPCHRVIREDGTSGLYRWGAERKLALRTWEAGHACLAVQPED
jgi:AraC family transcriptional regulator, regulatory protein of adaptative response / methylated-DNA-[protein]-cysteine methyltransferase